VGPELFDALRTVDPSTPSVVETFGRVVAGSDPRPDFYEYSVRVGKGSSPHRLTYYFDTHRRGASVAREAIQRFIRLGQELGVAVPAALVTFLQSDAPLGSEVLQLVVGVDAHADPARLRCKFYVVFRDNPVRSVDTLLAAVGDSTPGGADPSKVYILGVDVTASGLQEVKLYYRLEPARVPKVVENGVEIVSLLTACRQVVFLQSVRHVERRQMYLHAESSVRLSGWLLAHGYGEALARARTLNACINGCRLEPRILSLPYEQGRVCVGRGSVYFHLAE